MTVSVGIVASAIFNFEWKVIHIEKSKSNIADAAMPIDQVTNYILNNQRDIDIQGRYQT